SPDIFIHTETWEVAFVAAKGVLLPRTRLPLVRPYDVHSCSLEPQMEAAHSGEQLTDPQRMLWGGRLDPVHLRYPSRGHVGRGLHVFSETSLCPATTSGRGRGAQPLWADYIHGRAHLCSETTSAPRATQARCATGSITLASPTAPPSPTRPLSHSKSASPP